MAHILLNHLLKHLEQSPCRLRKGCGIVYIVFAARQLQEKCIEHLDLYTTFVDLTKSFDMVCREGLWKIMLKFGYPNWFLKIVRQFHECMMALVLDDGHVLDAFRVTNGEITSEKLSLAFPSDTRVKEDCYQKYSLLMSVHLYQ